MSKITWYGYRAEFSKKNKVLIQLDDKDVFANLPLYLKEVNHSPTGFEWGYRGSGPAQLAYAIMRTYFELAEGLSPRNARAQAQKFYFKFKEDYVCAWKGDVWAMTSDLVTTWVREQKENQI